MLTFSFATCSSLHCAAPPPPLSLRFIHATYTFIVVHSFWDLNELTQDISPRDSACLDAIEALRCVVCSPRQAHFMKYDNDKWEINVCLPTALATFEFCSPEKSTLFPSGAEELDRFGNDPRRMLTNLLTRNVGSGWSPESSGGSADDYDAQTGAAKGSHTPSVNIVPTVERCFLHDRAAPLMKGASASSYSDGTNIMLTLTFNEPLDSNSLRGKVVSLRPDMVNTSTRGGNDATHNEIANEAALLRVYKCATAECIRSSSSNEVDGDIVAVWDDLASLQSTQQVSVKTTDVGTGEIHLAVSGSARQGVDDGLLSKDAEFGYIVWMEQGAVSDASQNSFAGSDLDKDSLIRVDMAGMHKSSTKKVGSNVGAIIGIIVGSIVALILGVYIYTVIKRRAGPPPLSNQAMYSSGGFIKMTD